MIRTLLPAVAAVTILSGCVVDRYGRVVPPDPVGRAIVNTIDPVYEPEEYVVASAPPPLRREVRPIRPRGDVVWVDGHYDWRGRNWHWIPGRYVTRPRAGVRYVPGGYYFRNNRHYWRRGYWR